MPQMGKLESVHGIAPAFVQRAAAVAVLSFAFFLAMMVAFYLRQNIGYFLLATAFLLVYAATMFGWVILRRSALKIYENGIEYKKFAARWEEIKTVSAKDKNHYEIEKIGGERVQLPETLQNVEQIVELIGSRIAREN